MSPSISTKLPVAPDPLCGAEVGGVDSPSKSAEALLFTLHKEIKFNRAWDKEILRDIEIKKYFTYETWLSPPWFGTGLLDSLISFSGTRPGFFFFKTAKIEDSRSGKAGISSRTVACLRQIQI